jgi:hypothetical protein
MVWGIYMDCGSGPIAIIKFAQLYLRSVIKPLSHLCAARTVKRKSDVSTQARDKYQSLQRRPGSQRNRQDYR